MRQILQRGSFKARFEPHSCRHKTGIVKSPVEPYLQAMKTTIELPDSIVRKAKVIAAERRTTLRALVVQGLEHVITEKHVSAKDRAKKLFAAMDKVPEITAGKRLTRTEANAR